MDPTSTTTKFDKEQIEKKLFNTISEVASQNHPSDFQQKCRLVAGISIDSLSTGLCSLEMKDNNTKPRLITKAEIEQLESGNDKAYLQVAERITTLPPHWRLVLKGENQEQIEDFLGLARLAYEKPPYCLDFLKSFGVYTVLPSQDPSVIEIISEEVEAETAQEKALAMINELNKRLATVTKAMLTALKAAETPTHSGHTVAKFSLKNPEVDALRKTLKENDQFIFHLINDTNSEAAKLFLNNNQELIRHTMKQILAQSGE